MSKPFNPYASYETNEDHEVAGVWLVEPFFKVRIARAGGRNKRFQSRYDALTKPFKRAIQTKTLPPEIDEDLSRQLYADAVVKSWAIPAEIVDGKPVRDEKGEIVWIEGQMHDPETFEAIPFNAENVKRVFDTPGRGRELFSYIVGQANDVNLFRDEEAEEDDGKN